MKGVAGINWKLACFSNIKPTASSDVKSPASKRAAMASAGLTSQALSCPPWFELFLLTSELAVDSA
jgi:hypothetical protein